MAEEERVPLSEKDDTQSNDTTQSKDAYVPEEPTPDTSICLSDIQMPETPESTKGQISDGDTSRLESPKTVKPVLGKIQAKKRLMAFANQFKVLSKSQIKSNSPHSTGTLKTKDKTMQDDTNTNKSRKKTEEKILAIEEIRREESKSKMLAMASMAAASMEDENHTGKNTSNLLESKRHAKERSRHEGITDSRKSRSTINRKYSERHRHRDKTDRNSSNSSNREVKDRNESTERSTQKPSQDREKRKKEKKRKDDKDRRDDNKADTSRDKREEEKDRKENEKEKREETREKREGTKSKKENMKDKRNDMLEMEAEGKDKKEKDKDRWKEKELLKCNSWMELQKSGLTLDDISQLRRRDNTERSVRNRTAQDYTRYLEHMLMLNNYRVKRQALIAEGFDGPKKYPPESIKTTKRAKGSQLLYCENPRMSLFLCISQLVQAVSPERREKIRDICEASSSRFDTEDTAPQKRNWYQQINASKCHKNTKWQVTVQLPRSKWDSEDEETSVSAAKEEIEKPINKLHISVVQQERCSTSSSITDEDKVDNNAEDTKEDNESSEKTIDNTTTNDEASTSPLLQSTGDEKLASEYEQFMKMVCTVTDVTKEYLPKKNPVKTASPHSYHEFNIESNLAEDNTDIEIPLKEKTDKLQTVEGSIKSIECEESTISTDCQIQINENNMQIECTNSNDESEDSKSIPSDWENVRIKVERLSDENTESREIKKKKKQKKVMSSSDSSSSTSSSDSEKEKKRKKRKRKILSNSSSSDSDSTDSSSSSSDSSSDEKRKRRRKKKTVGKKRKKARRAARTKKKRRRKMSTDSSSSDSDERTKKKKKIKKKTKEAKSINNGDINKIISKSPTIVSPSDEAKVLHSGTSIKKIKEEGKDKKRTDQITSTRKTITGMSVHDNECMKQKGERKNKSDESFMEQWEVDSMIALQPNDGESSRDHTGELGKMDSSEKSTYRKKRKRSRDNVEQDKDRLSKVNEERIHEGKERSDEELEVKRKKRREKDVRSSTEFLADWEREGERINQQIIQNEVKFSKKLEKKQKKEKWGETDFDTLNVPSLTQLEKEVCQKQLLADEWEVDSLEAIPDLTVSKRKSSQSVSKKMEKEVRYDEKTDTYIAIEKESAKEMKKRQERLCAIRIWEEEQEEGEREEMMLLKQKNKHKDDWDIEEESFLRKNNEEIEIRKVNDIVGIEKEWNKPNEDTSVKEDSNKLEIKFESIGSKRVRKSRWDMGSHSEEKLETKDIWEEEYPEWSKINKCEQKHEETEKGESRVATYSEGSAKSDLIDFYHKKSQNRESLERAWTSEEMSTRSAQTKKVEEASVKNLISVKTNEEQIASTDEARDQFKEILELNTKFKEKTIELYSPSSPALSQKSQDIEASNDSSSSTSLPCKKRRKEMLIATEELSIPTAGIPLQLTKLRDTKHAANEKIENILDKVQLEDESSAHKFDIKKTDKLFDDLSMNELCPEAHNSQSACMDIFAEYGSEGSRSKQHAINSNISSATHTKDDETNAEKTALKLIPKQLLIRRTNEQVKPTKHILEAPLQDPAQHAAALLTIQKKLLESHVLENDIQKLPNEEPADQLKSTYSAESNSKVDKLLDTTEFTVASKSSVIAIQQSPASEKAISVRSERSENYDNRESKNDDVKKYKTSRNDINVPSGVRSPVREHRKKSPGKKESEKRYSHDYSRDKKERRSDDGEKSDRRDNKGFKADFADSRRKSSPSGRGKRKRSGSPYASWERQGSGSRSPGHSWSRSRSRSPRRKDEATTSMRDRDKRRERYDDERSNRPRTDERRERYARSSPRSYNEDNFKKHGSTSSKSNRDDWGRRRYDSVDREKDVRSYDPMELLRERTMESEKYRENRFRTEELDHTFWQYENSNILRDGNESVDSYVAGQDLPPNEYDDRTYYGEESLERDMIQCSPQPQPKYRRSQSRSSARRDWQWEKDKDSISDLDRHGHRLRNRTPPRSRYSPMRQERFRRKSKSRSRSWSQSRSRTRSRSRSRSTSRSRPRMRSRSRSRSRSPSDLRSRARSISTSRLRSPERGLRMSELRSSRSPSPGRSRLNEIGRERKDEDENRKLNVCSERGRRIETIVQSGVASGTNILDSEMGISGNMDAANFQYLNEIEGGNEYYYTENNLTYPPCIDESTTSSPKRLSLDDRLELELGIKKQHSKDSTGVSSDYSSNFNPNVITYPSPPPQQQQQMMYRQQPTVLQVGNVLQVVPADFNGVQSTRREVPAACTTPPVRPASSQVVRVGNVLQVVPTSLDWSNGQSTTADQSNGLLYSSAVPAPSPSASSVSISVPVPVPVPLPVPPAGTNTLAPVAPAAPLQLPLPIPVPIPVPIPPATAAAFPRNEVQSQKIVQPVYNYEAILETRRKEREERKRLRELRRKEKERKKIERINRRALRLLEKNNTSRQTGEVLDRRKGSVVDPLVLKALKEGEEQAETESPSQTNSVKEEEEEAASFIKEEDEDAAADEDEDDDEDEVEAEAEDDEEEEEEAEDEDEDDNDDDEKSSQMINQRIEVDEATIPADMNKDEAEIETTKEWPELPPPPLKGILIAPGFRRDSIPNGNLDDLSDVDDDTKDSSDEDEETDKNNECNKDVGPDAKSGKSKSAKLLKKTNRSKKSVQFADGIKPGEGTSPSGGEGDMPSPPPPKRTDLREGLKDLKRDKIYSSRKSRKQEKRARPPKTKKKVKVKIIKLKKPRVTPLTAMMMDDSDEMDDRSPPPPPPGSPPPPHLWPSYLSVYNTTVRTVEPPQTTASTLTPVQAPPPPTPLPLLVPPPPLNYTIQPCSKA